MNTEFKTDIKRTIWNLLLTALSCAFLAVGVNLVYEPLEMVIGGITGLAIAVKSLIFTFTGKELSVSLLNLILNIPILLAALKMKGWKFFWISLYGTLILSLMLAVVPIADIVKGDMFLATLIGGALTGVGMGIVFRAGLSTGGTDLTATLISMKTKRISQSVILGFVDGVIVVLGLSVFGIYKSIYALLALFIMTKVSDAVIAGFAYTKLLMIVTDKGESITGDILHKVKRGITVWKAKGAYSGNDKEILMCACGRKETGSVIDIVSVYDDKSFVVILSAKEILGEGFSKIL
ncbi:MAG: YitT family protein [Lachnospiraceae bacterium]